MDSLTAALEANPVFLLVALVLAGLAFITCIGLAIRLRALSKPLAKVRDSQDTAAMVTSILHTIDSAESKIESLTDALNTHVADSKHFIKHVGLVRYDAFEDIAGQQSYSLCLLDSHKNGLLMTYLTSKSTTRSYAVNVAAGEASRKLGDEERRALDEALGKRPTPEPVHS